MSSTLPEGNKSDYSLWLSPQSSNALLTDLILDLARRHSVASGDGHTGTGTQLQLQLLPFAPHATLFSDALIPQEWTPEQVAACTEQAVRDWRTAPSTLRATPAADAPGPEANGRSASVTCAFERLEAGAKFFQCVYVVLDKTGSEGLLGLHRALRRAFASPDPEGRSYFPHLSLVYGDLAEVTKQGIVNGMLERGEAINASGDKMQILGETGFQTDEILVVRTAGRSDEWEIVARVPLCVSRLSHEDL